MAPGLQGTLRDLVMGVVDRQVDDDVNRVVGEEGVERPMSANAVSLSERRGPGRIEVRGGNEPDLGMGEGVAGVATGDVAGSDDTEA